MIFIRKPFIKKSFEVVTISMMSSQIKNGHMICNCATLALCIDKLSCFIYSPYSYILVLSCFLSNRDIHLI